MVTVSCNCFNVNLQLVSSPTLTTDQKWIAEQMGTTKVGDAKIRGNGPILELDNLVSSRNVTGWKVWKCCNCNVDVCAIDINDVSRGLINMELEEHSGNDSHKIRANGTRFYSPCFRVILDDAEIAETQLLGASKDLHAIVAFNKLQKQVDSYVTAEERMMEKRIKAFIKEQQDAFNTVISRANKDRAILWKKICKLNTSYGSSLNATPDPRATSSPYKIASSAPSSLAPISSNKFTSTTTTNTTTTTTITTTATPTKKTEEKEGGSWQSAELSKQPNKFHIQSSSSADGGIFSFDDDDDGGTESPQNDSQQGEDPASDDEDNKRVEQPVVMDPSKMLGTSLPIHILKPLALALQPPVQQQQQPQQQPELAEERRMQKVPRESWSSRVAVGEDLPVEVSAGEELPAEVAASFAIPLSLNRRIKSLI